MLPIPGTSSVAHLEENLRAGDAAAGPGDGGEARRGRVARLTPAWGRTHVTVYRPRCVPWSDTTAGMMPVVDDLADALASGRECDLDGAPLPAAQPRRAAHRAAAAGRARAAAAARHGHRRAAALRRPGRRARRAARVHVRARPRPADGRARRARADRLAPAGAAGGQPARRRRPAPRRRLRRRGPRRPHRRADRRLAATVGGSAARAGGTRWSPTGSSSRAPATRAGCAPTRSCGCRARASPATSTSRAPTLTSPTGDALDLTGIAVGGSLLAGRHARRARRSPRAAACGSPARGSAGTWSSPAPGSRRPTIPDPAGGGPGGQPRARAARWDRRPGRVPGRRPRARRGQPGARRRRAHHRHGPAAQRVVGGYLRLSGARLDGPQGARPGDRAARRRDGGRRRRRGPRQRPRRLLLRRAGAAGRRARARHGEPLRRARSPRRTATRCSPTGCASAASSTCAASRCEGTLRMQNLDVGATLDCTGAALTRPRLRPDDTMRPSLDLRAADDRQGPRCASTGSSRPAACGCGWPTCTSPSSSSTPRSARSGRTRYALNLYGLDDHRPRRPARRRARAGRCG